MSSVAEIRIRRMFPEIFEWPKYTVSQQKCGQLRPYVHENFEKFKIISTPTP